MFFYLSGLLSSLFGPMRLLQSYLVLISVAFYIGFFLTVFILPRFYARLPKDRGREFTISPEAAKGKPTGGGVVFGPHPRSYSFSMPRKQRRLAIKCALSDKVQSGDFLVLESLNFDIPKTKDVVKMLDAFKVEKKALIITADEAENVERSSRNIPGVKAISAMGLNVSEEDTKNLADSIRKLGDAAEQISRMADLTDATKTYIEQISSVTANLERFNVVTNSLSEVSDSLVHSCEMIAGSKNEHSEKQTVGYVQQMEQLNQSLSGLNEFYSVHLSGLRSQMDTIQQINAGLSRIRDMYDNSVMDSTAFRNENERMAQLLAQLNQVYGRLLQAMTVNMPGGGTMYPPQQPPYQGGYPPQGYAQQPPYPNPR